MRTITTQAAIVMLLCAPAGNIAAEQTVEEALAWKERSAADRVSDLDRKPLQVLEFLEIKPGMRVLDLFSGGGYYTEIVSRVVGEDGMVVAHNNQAYIDYAADVLAGRFERQRLPNVQQVVAEVNDLELPPNSFDAALAMLTWHDFYYVDEENGWPAIDRELVVEMLCNALKPGAILGLTDHVALPGSDPEETARDLHRIDPQRIREDLESGCFRFEGEIDALRNPADDLTRPMFAEGIRGKTDRVVYRFRKVAAE
jgi:predicted methyltransferase